MQFKHALEEPTLGKAPSGLSLNSAYRQYLDLSEVAIANASIQ